MYGTYWHPAAGHPSRCKSCQQHMGPSHYGGNSQWLMPYSEYAGYYRIDLTGNNEGMHGQHIALKDYGPAPFAVNIEDAARQNRAFRLALWTGEHLQVTLMSIPVGEDIGLEMHPDLDQFIRIEEGQGLVRMGKSKEYLDFQARVGNGYAFVIPAGTWHNLTNTGGQPLKLYSIYAPPQHPHGTVHETKAIAMAAES